MEQMQKRKGIFTREDRHLNRELKWEYRILVGILFAVAIICAIQVAIGQIMISAGKITATQSDLYKNYSLLTNIALILKLLIFPVFAVIAVRYKKRPRLLFWICYFSAAIIAMLLQWLSIMLNPFFSSKSLLLFEWAYLRISIQPLLVPLIPLLYVKLILPRLKKCKSTVSLIIWSYLIMELSYLALNALIVVLNFINLDNKASIGIIGGSDTFIFLMRPYLRTILLSLLYSTIFSIVLVLLESLIFRQPPFNKAGMPLPVPDEVAESSTNAQEQSIPKGPPPVEPTLIEYSGEDIAKKMNSI